MKLKLLLFTSLFNYAYVYDLCTVGKNLCSDKHVLDNCKTESSCQQFSFVGNEKLNKDLGGITLRLKLNFGAQLFLNFSFSNVKWKKAYLKLIDHNDMSNIFCKIYNLEDEKLPFHGDLYDSCLWIAAKKKKIHELEYGAESQQYSMFKKLQFDMPDAIDFSDTLPIANRSVFAYIDFTSSQEIILYIQALPRMYNVTFYKVEVFRQKDATEFLLSEFLNSSHTENGVLHYKYQTSNEEGYYYFGITAICYRCSEDNCRKTITSKVYISRKGTPLVIGIVGASFIIPFVLFIFHMWNRRFKPQGGLPDTVEKILILFKPSSDKHNDVVTTLAKTVKHLTGIEVMSDPVNLTKTKPKNADKWCSDNLILATYIIYIAPPENDENNCELDYMTYNFLKAETKKSIPEKDIIILKFPYSTSDLPSILTNCIKFELMGDFQKFLNVFQPVSPDFNYENNINCMELMKKIKLAQAETDTFKNKDNPKIIITDQSELSDEPKEIDVLL